LQFHVFTKIIAKFVDEKRKLKELNNVMSDSVKLTILYLTKA